MGTLTLLGAASLLPLGPIAHFYASPFMIEFVLGIGLAMILPRISAGVLAQGPWVFGLGLLLLLIAGSAEGAETLRLVTFAIPATLIVGGLVAWEMAGTLPRIAVLKTVGDASYPLYMLHPILLSAMAQGWRAFGLTDLSPWLYVATAMVAACGAGYGVCVLLGGALLLAESRRPRNLAASDHQPLPSLIASALPLLVVETAQAALLSVPVLLLGAFSDPTSVSVFSLCNRLSMLVATVVLSLGAMAAPAYARYHRLGQWAALRHEDGRNRLASAAICIPLILVLALGAAPLLRLLAVDPSGGVPVLLILLAGQLVFCLLPSRDLLLAMAGQGRVLRTLSLWQLVLCTGLCVLVIPVAGAVGAALGSSATWILGAVGLAVAVRSRIPQMGLRNGGRASW